MAISEATLIDIEQRPAEARTNASVPMKKAPRRRASGTSSSQKSARRLEAELRGFVAEHPDGWGHQEWIGLLDRLRDAGHDTDDSEEIGRRLERERLTLTLQRVRGLGPQRIGALVDHYNTLWNLRAAGLDEVAKAGRLSRPLAERVCEEVR